MELDALEALLGESLQVEEHRDIWVVALGDGLPTDLIGEARRMADALGAYVHVVGPAAQAKTAIACGADRVHTVEPLDSPEASVATLDAAFAAQKPEFVLFPAGSLAQEVAPRLAERMRGGLVMNCAALRLDEVERRVIASCPVYRGDYFLDRSSRSNPQMFTVRPGVFSEPVEDETRVGETVAVQVSAAVSPMVRSLGPAQYTPLPTPLRDARRVVAVGRAGNDSATVGIAQKIAEVLEAHFAGDRSAFDSGFIAREQIIGVVGTEVAPELYLAIGIWGDILHNAGIEGARKVVAVHPDARAPMLQIADVAVVAEPVELLPRLLEALKE